MTQSTQQLLKTLGIQQPIILAPMAGATNADIVAKVSNAGGLGSFGAASTKPEQLRVLIRDIRKRTDLPFNINLFSGSTEKYDHSVAAGDAISQRYRDWHTELELDNTPEPIALFGPAEEQLDVLISEKVPVISFHFGVDQPALKRAQQSGATVLCSATSVCEAVFLEKQGVDIVIAQGAEAGGHRGTFIGDYRDSLIGTFALVPQIVDAVNCPVIAAGGIMDARGIVAALTLGASAAQMGTAFLGCTESKIPTAWVKSLKNAEADQIAVTEVISGKPARGIKNRFIDELETINDGLLPYPAHYSLSRLIRAKAAKENDADFLAMWSGQGVGLFKETTVESLMQELLTNSETLLGHRELAAVFRKSI